MIVKQQAQAIHTTQKRSLHILLVEKNWSDQRLISKMLAPMGCTLTSANNLQEAGNLIRNTDVDMILMDTEIFKQNGFDIMAAVSERRKQSGHPLPMIAMARDCSPEHRDYFVRIGMDAYIPKPVFEVDLHRVMGQLAEPLFSAGLQPPSHSGLS